VRRWVLFFLFISSVCIAGNRPDFRGNSCVKKAEGLIQQWGEAVNWSALPNTDPDKSIYQSPTRFLGVWIRLQTSKNNLRLTRISQSEVTNVVLSGSRCSPTLSIQKQPLLKHDASVLTDDLLLKFLAQNPDGFMYSWSPAMPLSIDGLEEVKRAARSLEQSLVVVLDPNASLNVARKIAKKRGWPDTYLRKPASVEITLRGILDHYPTMTHFRNGQLSNRILPGMKTATDYVLEAKRDNR